MPSSPPRRPLWAKPSFASTRHDPDGRSRCATRRYCPGPGDLATNRAKLAALKNPRPQDIAIAQGELDQARSNVNIAQDARDNCGNSKTTTTTKDSTGTRRALLSKAVAALRRTISTD